MSRENCSICRIKSFRTNRGTVGNEKFGQLNTYKERGEVRKDERKYCNSDNKFGNEKRARKNYRNPLSGLTSFPLPTFISGSKRVFVTLKTKRNMFRKRLDFPKSAEEISLYLISFCISCFDGYVLLSQKSRNNGK